MKDVLWIEHIIESTPVLSSWTNFKVGMASFVISNKVVAKKRIHFQLFQVHKMEVKRKKKRKKTKG
jgi:hypothetical protein